MNVHKKHVFSGEQHKVDLLLIYALLSLEKPIGHIVLSNMGCECHSRMIQYISFSIQQAG